MKEYIKQLLRESILKSPFKGRYILYHSTQIDKGISILNDDKILGASKQTIKTSLNPSNPNYNQNSKNYNGVSLTRNISIRFSDMQFILDGNLIKNDYGKKLVPHDYFKQYKGKSDPNRSDIYESEEFLIGNIEPLSKYLLGIRFVSVYQKLNDFIIDDPEGYEILKQSVGDIPIYDENFKLFKL